MLFPNVTLIFFKPSPSYQELNFQYQRINTHIYRILHGTAEKLISSSVIFLNLIFQIWLRKVAECGNPWNFRIFYIFLLPIHRCFFYPYNFRFWIWVLISQIYGNLLFLIVNFLSFTTDIGKRKQFPSNNNKPRYL